MSEIPTMLQKKETVETFFKEAFNVDGTAEIISGNRQQKKAFKILSVVKLTDSTRGEFYIASVTPKL